MKYTDDDIRAAGFSKLARPWSSAVFLLGVRIFGLRSQVDAMLRAVEDFAMDLPADQQDRLVSSIQSAIRATNEAVNAMSPEDLSDLALTAVRESQASVVDSKKHAN